MKKALLLILAIVAVCFLIANADYLADFLNTMATGALVPIVIAIILMIARHLVQAASYDAAFDAVGHKTGFWHNVVLIFSLVFINTFCLFSGATGVAFIIDDAHREGLDAGQSTGGAILSQIGYFAAVFVISVIGFLTMWLSGHMNTVFLIGGLLLAGVLVVLSSLFFVGHLRPRMLYRVFIVIERVLNKMLGLFKRSMKSGWGRNMAHSFIATSNLLAKNPQGSLITIAYASFSAILNMACLVAIGYAFGFEHVEALVAAFAVAAISVILSPTPQGVGVVEAMIVAILTAYGCSVATATAIALVYRGIMFWIPFCIGAVMLSQSGFFRSKKSATALQKHKDIAWISGTLVFLIGAVNIGCMFQPTLFTPYTMLTSWIDMSSLMVGIPLLIGSIVLMILAVGLVFRFRTAWALTIGALALITGSEFLFQGTWQVGIAGILLVLWLFAKRAAFDRPFSREAIQADLAAWKKRRAEKRKANEQNRQPAQGRRRNSGAAASRADGTARTKPSIEGTNASGVSGAVDAADGSGAPSRHGVAAAFEDVEHDIADVISEDKPDISGWEEQVRRGQSISEEYLAKEVGIPQDKASPFVVRK